MNRRFSAVEQRLNRAEFRWKTLRLVRHSAILGIAVCAALGALALAIDAGALTNRKMALIAWAILASAGLLGWCVLLVRILVQSVDRPWLAAALERIDRRWLDRLNTLFFLEQRRTNPRAESFASRIAAQAQAVADEPAHPSPFSARASMLWLLAFLFVLAGTLSIYLSAPPWARLRAVAPAGPGSARPFELGLAANNVETNSLWGEVRITEPGSDLQVTKADVVPLQIEAAASQPLDQVTWQSAVNGGEEVLHPLPAPAEPRFAAYHPTLFVDDFHLSDWDVLTYYAKATTDQKDSFASQVYFLEVRPFREDIQKLPGGAAGQAYSTLNELSQLIARQEQVIRQTYQHLHAAPATQPAPAQDAQKLAGAENELGGSAQHLHARLAAQAPNQPIDQTLDHLTAAQDALEQAAKLLADQVSQQAPPVERRALADLVAARKMFQQAVSSHPDAFADNHQPPASADSAQQLNQMAEFSDEAKAAQEFVQKTLEQQKNLQHQTYAASANSEYNRLAETEQQLQQQLRDFQSQHPQPFKGSEAAANRAGQAMTSATDSLRQASPQAQAATQQATRALEQFSHDLQQQNTQRQLADAYRLKQMLDQQSQSLGQQAQPDSKLSEQQLQQTARDAHDTVKQLARTAEQEPTRNVFGQPLRNALGGQNRLDLEAKLRQLQQAQGEAEQRQSAAEARDKLDGLSKAFDASQPKSLQLARRTDALKPSEQEGFTLGLSELQSLLERLQQGRQLPNADQAKQGQQALDNLQQGMRSRFGNDNRGQDLLHQLEQLLRREGQPHPDDLKNLLAELQRFSQENSVQLAQDQDGPALNNIDPSRLPPAYRGRIQKYFQKLSEK